MSNRIKFAFEEKRYECGPEFYETNKCVLPDGRVIEADGWYESIPPRPSALKVCAMATAFVVD